MHPEVLPQDIGPHDGREFSLMREGKKNVALFFEIEPEGLEDLLEDGFVLLKFLQFKYQGKAFFTRIVFRRGYEADALRLKEIVSRDTKGVDEQREHEIGKILSYTPDQVDAYIHHLRRKMLSNNR